LDKSCIPERYAPFSDAINAWTPFSKTDSDQPPTENYWHVGIIAVDPKYQRCGIGTRLLQWGLEQAERERVPVALEASEKGFGLYKKMGFKTAIETNVVDNVKMIGMIWEPGDLSNKKKVA
jgi:GNAT superfamily N-acetyltransferase